MESGRVTTNLPLPPAGGSRAAQPGRARPDADGSGLSAQQAPNQTIVQPESTSTVRLSTAAQQRETARIADEVRAERDSVDELVQRIAEQINIERRSLSFQVNREVGKTIVSVIDLETDEVIRQIPSEELVRISKAIEEINQQRSSLSESIEGIGLLIQEQA